MNNEDNLPAEKINLFALGNSTVGKTSIILRFCKEEFLETYITTVGIDYLAKDVTLPDNNKKIKICFYDTAGEEKYKAIAFNLIKSADGILLMYDITSMKSFESISEWIKSILTIKGEDFPIMLIGNKSDLEENREVDKEDGENEAKQNNLHFYETSNKTGNNVKEAVMDLVKLIVEQNKKKKSENENNVKNNNVNNNNVKLNRKEIKKKHKTFC